MLKICICDDEHIIRQGLKKLIESASLDVHVLLATHGEEALQIIQKEKPAIVLMDINMPGIKGLDVIEQSAHCSPRTKFIVISGHDEFEFAQRACRLNVLDYLLKPVDKKNLIQVIEKASKVFLDEGMMTKIIVPHLSHESLAEQAYALLHERYQDSSFSLQEVSKFLNCSQSYLTRCMKQQYQKSFSELLSELRLNKAIECLADPNDLKLWEIADAVGYTSQHYFSRVFKNMTGYTPQEYRILFFRNNQT